jgi:hypothetical protein
MPRGVVNKLVVAYYVEVVVVEYARYFMNQSFVVGAIYTKDVLLRIVLHGAKNGILAGFSKYPTKRPPHQAVQRPQE